MHHQLRAAAPLSKALQAEARADVRGMLTACARGLDALDEHRLMMGEQAKERSPVSFLLDLRGALTPPTIARRLRKVLVGTAG